RGHAKAQGNLAASDAGGTAFGLSGLQPLAWIAAGVVAAILSPGVALAQVTCPPSYVSGTTPLPQCLQLIRDTAPAAQAAIFGAQQTGTQSNAVVLDRMTSLRQQA